MNETIAQPVKSEADAMLDWLEEQARQSPTGITLDWCRYVEDGQVIEKGFRFMRKHHLGDRHDTIRKAIRAEMEAERP